jgi:hypothetical protein
VTKKLSIVFVRFFRAPLQEAKRTSIGQKIESKEVDGREKSIK